MKMRALYTSGKGKMKAIAEMLAKNGTYAADVIPPAYSCERERLIVIVVTAKSNMPDSFRRFCQELSKDKAQNVALVVDGKADDVTTILSWLQSAGTNVIDDILYFPVSFFGGLSKSLSAEESSKVSAWYEGVLTKLV